jgi:hypothetical protein
VPRFVDFAEAKKCPECGQTGELLYSNRIQGGGTLHTLICRNERCATQDMRFFVETDHNGNVQVNEEAWQKAHETRESPAPDVRADRLHQQVHAELARQIAKETRPE